MSRVIIIGPPMAGKSTYASKLGLPHYCTDPKALTREVLPTATYMPDGLGWSDQSDFIVSQWFNKPGSWVIEGVGAVRALRKFAQKYPYSLPCDEIIVLHGGQTISAGQDSMAKSVMTIWGEISTNFTAITKHVHR